MKNLVFYIFILLKIGCFSQTSEYKLINDVYSNESLYLASNFIPYKDVSDKYLNDEFIRNNWAPLPSAKIPPKAVFFKANNLCSLKKKASSQNLQGIDFGMLNSKNIKKIDLEEEENNWIERTSSYRVISKPIFNKTGDWAILYTYTVYAKLNTGSSGYIVICRKQNSKWSIYHRLTVWIG